MSARQGFIGNGGEPFIYQENTTGVSAALGIDTTGTYSISVSPTADARPNLFTQLTIDPVGDITLTPIAPNRLIIDGIARITSTTNGLLSVNAFGNVGVTAPTNHTVQVGNSSGTLTSLALGTAGWVLTSNGAADPSFQALPAGGVTSLAGTANQVAVSAATGAVTISTPATFIAPGSIAATTTITATLGDITATAGNLVLPMTTATVGQIIIDSFPYFHGYGSSTAHRNVFAGKSSGNFIMTDDAAIANSGFGANSLTSLTTGAYNQAFGDSAMSALQDGQHNCALGQGALSGITSGSFNYAFGDFAAGNLTAGDSSNIHFGSYGTAGDNNIIRIGESGSGSHQQNKCHIAGIAGITAAGTVTTATILNIDSSDQIGTVQLQSAGTTITITQPSNGVINLEAAVEGVTSITGTSQQITASSPTGDVTLSLPDTVVVATEIDITNGIFTVANTQAATTGTEIQLIKSRTGGVITSGDVLGYMIFKGNDGTSNVVASQIKSTSSGTIATNRVASSLEFFTHPDSTTATTQRMVIAPTGAVTINAPDSGVGLTVAGGGVTLTTGNVAITSGNLTLPNTNSGGTIGEILMGGNRILHNAGTRSVFLGDTAGLTNNTGTDNTVAGYQALTSITSGTYNAVLGSFAAIFLTTGTANIFIGTKGGGGSPFGVGGNYTGSESSNILLNNLGTVGESNKLRIGSGTGTGVTQLNGAFISGIQGITVTGTAVLVSSSDQLGVAVSSRRFKDNIQDMESYSSSIMKLRPVTFNYNVGEDDSLQSGLVAEEVYDVMPSLVIMDKEGLPQTVKYHDLPVLLLNEIQKLNRRIAALEGAQ